jgi:multidrug efflux pump subunit AcrA (membrane-fusion protein)
MRDEVLEHRATRTQSDDPLRVDQPRAWLALAGFATAALALVVFGFAGALPRTLTAPGVVEHPNDYATIDSLAEGQVREFVVAPGDAVEAGDAVVDLYDAAGRRTTVRSPFAGRVAELLAGPGEVVLVGSALFTLERTDVPAESLVVYAFVGAADVGSLAPGMPVAVLPRATREYGAAVGRVLSVESSPSTRTDVEGLLLDDELVSLFTGFTDADDSYLVTVELTPDPSTPSGLRWSSGTGPPFELSPDTPVDAEIRLGSERPVDLVLGG